jgi:ribosomal protein S20
MSGIDKAVSKGIIHRNRGARLKSRLMKKLNKK